MKNALRVISTALMAFATAATQAVTVVDSFDSGVSNAALNVVVPGAPGTQGFRTTNPGINSALAGTDNTRHGELFGYGPSTGVINVPLDGSAAMSFAGQGHVSLSYSFLADLRGYSTLNVEGSGTADMIGMTELRIYLTDADGDEAGKRMVLDGAFGNLSINLSAMDDFPCCGNGSFDLGRVSRISVYAEVGWSPGGPSYIGSISQTITEINLTPVPEPDSYALMVAGLSVLGLLARRRQRAG